MQRAAWPCDPGPPPAWPAGSLHAEQPPTASPSFLLGTPIPPGPTLPCPATDLQGLVEGGLLERPVWLQFAVHAGNSLTAWGDLLLADRRSFSPAGRRTSLALALVYGAWLLVVRQVCALGEGDWGAGVKAPGRSCEQVLLSSHQACQRASDAVPRRRQPAPMRFSTTLPRTPQGSTPVTPPPRRCMAASPTPC